LSRKKPALVARFFYLINNLVALATWATYLAWFINPSTFPVAGILALTVPAFILANFIFLIVWLIFFRRYIWLSLITLALGFWHISGLVGFNSKTINSQEETFRVMNFNSKYYFAGFTWAKTYAPKEEVQAFVNEVDPDIFCIQEFQKAKNWVPRHKLKHRFLSKHISSHLAIFSAYPFLNTGEVEYPLKTQEYDKFIYADILKGSDTLRIVVAHLASFGLEDEDLSNIKNFDQLPEEKITSSGKNVFTRLNNAYKKHGVQVNTLIDFIDQSPYPVLFFGDLNDTPTSYAYRKLTNRLNDSFREAGAGFGTSHVRFSKNRLPLRIDHILIDPKFKATDWQIVKKEYSDHFPIYADLIRDITQE
jgi:vancomycin resistance protein VanJ